MHIVYIELLTQTNVVIYIAIKLLVWVTAFYSDRQVQRTTLRGKIDGIKILQY